MSERIRCGVVGFGRWAPNLVRNLAKQPGVTIGWIADTDTDARQRALLAGYPASSDPFNNGAEPVQAIAVATPIATHSRIVHQAIDSGLHVLCEKPLSTVASVARNLGNFAKHSGVTLMVSSPWLYHPAIIRAGAVARELGAPLWFRSTRTSWDERPLDPIADLLPHDVGILQAWTGQRIARVSALSNGHTASVTLVTDGGVVGTVQYSYRDREKRRDTAIGYERGVLTVDGVRLRCSGDDGLRFIATDVADDPEPLDAMCAEFVACIREGRQPRHGNIAEAIHVAEVIEAAHTSIREQRVVSV